MIKISVYLTNHNRNKVYNSGNIPDNSNDKQDTFKYHFKWYVILFHAFSADDVTLA